jgi:phosphoglycerate dehydrogenase-like enzyme
MRVIGCVEHPTQQREAELLEERILLTSFDYVVENADFLSIHVPLQKSTENLINADVLTRMKKGAFLFNLARGGVLDETALLRRLRAGHIRGAALDVHSREGEGNISQLAELPNVVLTPHIGANTMETQREIADEVLAIVAHFTATIPQPSVAEVAAQAA